MALWYIKRWWPKIVHIVVVTYQDGHKIFAIPKLSHFFTMDNLLLLTPDQMVFHGLQFLGVDQRRQSASWKKRIFKKHFGTTSLVLATIWFDLQTCTDTMTQKEKSMKGLRMFLICHYFLWTYPKSSDQISTLFNICERYSRGENIWKWVRKVASLKQLKIKWRNNLDSAHSETFILSLDGTDFRVSEPKHPTMNIDKTQCSKKFAHAALKYELAICVFHSCLVWINGPHPGGKNDITIFREGGLKEKIRPGKLVIADRGYQSSLADEQMLSCPNPYDSQRLAKFKSRARSRHEGFNGRLKKYGALQQTFIHGREKHKLVMEAVCTILQYEMENGIPLFAV